MTLKLYQFPNELKKLITGFIIALTLGVSVGLIYLYHTTNYSPKDTIVRFNGSGEQDDSALQEEFPKPISELLVTTHNHVITFALIFAALGIVFYFNSIITGKAKFFLLVEPFASTILSFGGIWLMRFVNEKFIYITVASSLLLYLSFFVMSIIVLYELIFKKAE